MKERIEQGLKGEYSGLDNGLDRINQYIFGVQRACYTLLGGNSGSGKTTFVDFILLNAIADAEKKNIPINIIYYSWEIDEYSKRASWLSCIIYNKYGIIIPPETIKGFGNNRLTKEELDIVLSELPELERIFSKINWHWEANNPTGMYKDWWSFMSQRGNFVKESYTNNDGEVKEKIVEFKLNNPLEYNIVVVDHLALAKKSERGFSLKENIDKLSEYAVSCRNMFKMSFMFLQQYNQGLL